MNMHLQKIINNEKGIFYSSSSSKIQNPTGGGGKSNRGEGEGEGEEEGPMVWISPVIGERQRSMATTTAAGD